MAKAARALQGARRLAGENVSQCEGRLVGSHAGRLCGEVDRALHAPGMPEDVRDAAGARRAGCRRRKMLSAFSSGWWLLLR